MPGYCIAQLKNKSATTISYMSADDNAKHIKTHHEQTLSAFSAASQQCKTLFILPADEVVILQAKLPQGIKPHRIQQALPFALQEQLADKSELYHFVPLGKQQEDGHINVAVIDQTHLQEWISWLKDLGIHADVFLPAMFSLPYHEDAISICINDDSALVRSAPYAGFFSDTHNLTMMLEYTLQQYPAKTLNIYQGQGEEISVTLEAANELNIKHHQQNPNQYEKMLTQQAIANQDCNLLVGMFRARHKQNKVNKLWLTSVILVALIILISVVNMIVRYSVYTQRNSNLIQQIDAIYKQNFPDSTSIVAPKQRMQSKLHTQGDGAQGNVFLTLLGKSGKVLSNANGININAMDFSNKRLRLSLNATNFSAISQLTQQLQQQQLSVTSNNARTRGNAVTTDIIIKEQQ